jgi:hypothetical protein
MELTRELTISTMEGGAVIERLELALKDVLSDCADINKLPDGVREINCKIKVKPDDNRMVLAVGVEINTKLGPRYPIISTAWLDEDNGTAIEPTGKQQELPLTMPSAKQEQELERMTVIGGSQK